MTHRVRVSFLQGGNSLSATTDVNTQVGGVFGEESRVAREVARVLQEV